MKLKAVETSLGHHFTRPEFLRQALTHRSFGVPHNERLEFLGDSILNCVIAHALFLRYAECNEGELSRLRASLVRQETLAEVALSIRLGEHLRLGEGELKSGGFSRPSTLADALEAVFAAVFLDAGFIAAQQVIDRLFSPWILRTDPQKSGKDPKTVLQELMQGRRLSLPSYSLVALRGEAHAQEFEVSCAVATLNILCVGKGSSRRIAEQEAARAALTRIDSKKK
ncbi:MAG TPA: ribonuclease III [Rugosibacter sp.]